jgi:hypothetical protein
MISRAISSEASSAQRSAVLKCDDADRVIELPGHQIGNHAFQIGPLGSGLGVGAA